MTSETGASPCATCVVRHSIFCDALMSRSRQDSSAPERLLRRAHHAECAERKIYRAARAAQNIYIVCRGWAARVRRLSAGRQQILSFLLPGDLVSATVPFNGSMQFSVQAITDLHYTLIDRSDFVAALSSQSDLLENWGRTFGAEIEEADQLVTDLGRRQPKERVARLILGLMERLAARGLVDDQSFAFPLRERHIADAMGLTAGQVGRLMRAFCKDGLIEMANGMLKIVNLIELQRLAQRG